MKTDTGPAATEAHDHTHRDVSGGALRPVVFGAMDGLVTNLSLIAGVGGGGADRSAVVLVGVAGLVAGAFSMATGEYASVRSQNESVRAEVAIEERELLRHPDAEVAELAASYVARGVSTATATAFARELSARPEEALRVHAQQELGVDPVGLPSPWTAAGGSFVSFALGALLPLLPYLFGLSSLPAALAIGAAGLVATGAAVARVTRQPVLAVIIPVLGGAATAVVYLVGRLVGS